MKLLKYVMTTDCGLAPNPYFGVYSLALCTPNHMNAKLEVGDWVVGHSSRKRGNRLIYAMRLTKILDMPSYFAAFPEKRPNPTGSLMEQCGDNLYDYQGGQWTRLPSACHNNVAIFKQDQGHPVFWPKGKTTFGTSAATIISWPPHSVTNFPNSSRIGRDSLTSATSS